MTEQRDALAARVRDALPADRSVREVSMFGGVSFMVDNAIVVAAGRDGGLLVRVDPERSTKLLTVTGARQAVMGADRDMGPGWITVSADELRTEQLAFWIQVALEHHATKAGSSRASRTR